MKPTSIQEAKQLKQAKKEYERLEKLMEELDTVSEILYNNLDDGGIWSLLKHLESIKFDYSMRMMHYNEIIDKGV